jgi:hypothetical protein
MPNPPEVPPRVREALDHLAQALPARRGSVAERRMKCGKKGCPCASREDARHGPYFSVTRHEGGKTISRWLSAEEVTVAKQQIEAGQRLRREIDALWEASEQWADAELDTQKAASVEVAEKKGSRPNSGRRSPRKSRS